QSERNGARAPGRALPHLPAARRGPARRPAGRRRSAPGARPLPGGRPPLSDHPTADGGPMTAGRPDAPASPDPEPRAAGAEVRREGLGDAHVDRATAAATDFTAPFQDFITRYAWGEIWTSGVLDRRTRSCMVLTAMIAQGHWDELAMHVRAAKRNGLTDEEIR